MSFNPFEWLRKMAAKAVRDGIADALQQSVPEGDPPADLESPRAMVAEGLPAKDDDTAETPAAKKRGAK
jgi:hypothetical protein